jgi:hypothetical protein
MAWGIKCNLFKKSIFFVVTLPNYMKLILNFRLLINFDRPIPLWATSTIYRKVGPKARRKRRTLIGRPMGEQNRVELNRTRTAPGNNGRSILCMYSCKNAFFG